MVTKLYLHLKTACGCTRIIEHPVARLIPMKYYVALPAPTRVTFSIPEQTEMFDPDTFPRRRVFELRHDGVKLSENEYIYYYEEIVE